VLGHFLRLDSKDLPLFTTLRIYNNRGEMFDGHPEHTNALQLPTLADLSLSFSDSKGSNHFHSQYDGRS
jgi:hypothetical protein